jgi:hypothetical protein
MNATDLNADVVHEEYNHATEALLILSTVVFYMTLFVIIKSHLIDSFVIMRSAESLRENLSRVAAMYFAIVVCTAIFMVPLYHYKYSAAVAGLISCSVAVLIYRDIHRTLRTEPPGRRGGLAAVVATATAAAKKSVRNNKSPVPVESTPRDDPF